VTVVLPAARAPSLMAMLAVLERDWAATIRPSARDFAFLSAASIAAHVR